MNKDVIVRNARKEDFEQVYELVIQIHQMHVQNRSDIYKDTAPIDFNMFVEELSNENNIYLVAEEEKKILGICFAEIKKVSNNKIMKDRNIMHISNICVNKDTQRKGIGKKLYNEILKLARKLEVDSIELMVWGFNDNAINFYKSLGMNVKNVRFEQKIT